MENNKELGVGLLKNQQVSKKKEDYQGEKT